MPRLYLGIRNLTKQRIPGTFLEKIAKKSLAILKVRGKLELSLTFVDDRKMRTLNRRYRGEDKSTDVLAFSMKDKRFFAQPEDVLHLGEIFISYPRAKRQADICNHPLKKELAILFIHGLLHLLGYTHRTKEKAKGMVIEEKTILKKLNL